MRRTVAVLGSGILLVTLAACSATDSTVPPQPSSAPSASEAAPPSDDVASAPTQAAVASSAPLAETGDQYPVFNMPGDCASLEGARIPALWQTQYPAAVPQPDVGPSSDVSGFAPGGLVCSLGVDGDGIPWLTVSAAAAGQYDILSVFPRLEAEGYTRLDLGEETYFTLQILDDGEGVGDDEQVVRASVAMFTPRAWFEASTRTASDAVIQSLLTAITQDMRDRLHG